MHGDIDRFYHFVGVQLGGIADQVPILPKDNEQRGGKDKTCQHLARDEPDDASELENSQQEHHHPHQQSQGEQCADWINAGI